LNKNNVDLLEVSVDVANGVDNFDCGVSIAIVVGD